MIVCPRVCLAAPKARRKEPAYTAQWNNSSANFLYQLLQITLLQVTRLQMTLLQVTLIQTTLL